MNSDYYNRPEPDRNQYNNNNNSDGSDSDGHSSDASGSGEENVGMNYFSHLLNCVFLHLILLLIFFFFYNIRISSYSCYVGMVYFHLRTFLFYFL